MSIVTPLMWGLFGLFVLVALCVDFLAMNRQGAHKVSTREAAIGPYLAAPRPDLIQYTDYLEIDSYP